MTQTVELQKKGLDRIRVFSGAQLKYIAFLIYVNRPRE